jgi:hypothetical protein
MIVKLGYLFPYYYFAPDRNKFNGMYEWVKYYGGKINELKDGLTEIEFSEEDYIILKLKFCL